VRAIEEEETTESGLVLPDSAKEKPQKGKVIAVGVGPIDEESGRRAPLDVSEGDEILYKQYGGTEIKVDGEELLVLRESDVFARVAVGADEFGVREEEVGPDSAPDLAGLRRGVAEDIRRLHELAK
jgi:chaperonin GroES